MKSPLRLAWILVVGLLAFASCVDNDSPLADCEDTNSGDEEEEQTIAPRTVLAYIVGDNQSSASDLSSLLKVNIDSMYVGMASVSDGRMLILSKLSSSDDTYLIRLKNTSGVVSADTLYTYSDVNPLADDFMLDVMQTAFSEYPAESYGFAFLSHGEGWVEASTSASTRYMGVYQNTGMNIADFHYVLAESGYHLDFVLFDACFMQAIEVAYELRDVVDYFIGSPTEIPGPGADYSVVLPAMFSTDSDFAEDIATAYYQPYADKYTGGTNLTNDNWTAGVSVSVIASEGLDELAEQAKAIFSAYSYDQKTTDIMRYDRRSKRYYYDLDGLMAHLTDEDSAYDAWRVAFDEAVPCWLTTELNYSSSGGLFSMSGAEGVSTFIPLSSTSSSVLSYYQTYEWSTYTGWGQ